MKYHVWTEGCQMNVADSQRLASELEKLGYQWTPEADKADVVVLNTCVVRQSAEDKAYGRLTSLRPVKEHRPDMVLGVMGCMVGVRGGEHLRQALPYVDVFLPPSEPGPLVDYLRSRSLQEESRQLFEAETQARFRLQDEAHDGQSGEHQADELVLPLHQRGKLISAHVPVVYGCSHACTFCIIPFRRGIERSRLVGEIVAEIRSLVSQGVKEITLLGQIVDRYGKDVPDGPDLADLLRIIHPVDGLERIRFLTSHPNWMTDKLLDTVAELPKVCEHIEVPIQAGDDQVLANMKRGYTAEDYRRLIARIRERIPGVSIATDIIVGFPGETAKQFQETYDLLAELKLDVAHVAKYSPRPGTVSARRMPDDVPLLEKEQRRRALDELQAQIVSEINCRYLNEFVEVMVEDEHKGKWRGRTRTNKLVFFEDLTRDWRGQCARVVIRWTGPWSMQGTLAA